MRKKIIVGNWKMNGSNALIQQWLVELASKQLPMTLEAIILPPFPYLASAQELTQYQIVLGAQNLSQYSYGAYTGEVSATMLTEFDVRYVLIGHSERRQYFNETSAIIANKIKAANQAQICPILCIGETLVEYETKQSKNAVKQQLLEVLSVLTAAPKGFVIAYEPVWAIGTGQSATALQAQQMLQFIRQLLVKEAPLIAQQTPLLYGGSITSANAHSLFNEPDIDGGLIGGASLEISSFLSICSAME